MNIFELPGRIEKFALNEKADFHMPGHKRRISEGSCVHDFTELYDTDNLYSPEDGGALVRDLDRLSRVYKSAATVVSAGGSSAALMAAVLCAVRRGGKKIICSRRVHRSVVYAFSHCGVEPVWFIDESDLPRILRENPDAAAALLTSPDYYGRMADVAALSALCKGRGVPLIVDSAHGAHLDFFEGGRLSALANGASLTVESLHKTLPAMTGAALLHSDGTFSRDEMLSAISAFASTSPPYPITISALKAVEFMVENGERLLSSLLAVIGRTDSALAGAGYGKPDFLIRDPFRMTYLTRPVCTPLELYDYLYKSGVVCEFCDRDNIVLIPSVMNDPGEFSLFAELACRFARDNAGKRAAMDEDRGPALTLTELPERVMSVRNALTSAYETTPAEKSAGRICAECAALYPPGIAILAPGERISEKDAEKLLSLGVKYIKTVKN